MASTSGQVWGHTPEQRVATSTLRRYFIGLRLTIAQADTRPPCPYPSDRPPSDATMKRVVCMIELWFSHNYGPTFCHVATLIYYAEQCRIQGITISLLKLPNLPNDTVVTCTEWLTMHALTMSMSQTINYSKVESTAVYEPLASKFSQLSRGSV